MPGSLGVPGHNVCAQTNKLWEMSQMGRSKLILVSSTAGVAPVYYEGSAEDLPLPGLFRFVVLGLIPSFFSH